VGTDSGPGLDAADPSPAASRAVYAREELDWLLRSLGPDDRSVLAARLDGTPWADLAADRGVGADALRKRLARALDEVAGQIGLGDERSG
jgi:DNA-directed RNA polymerase specialized sigma24 family protein